MCLTVCLLHYLCHGVGLSEKEAQAQGIEYELKKLPVAAIPKAHVLKDPGGLFKALIDPKTNSIL